MKLFEVVVSRRSREKTVMRVEAHDLVDAHRKAGLKAANDVELEWRTVDEVINIDQCHGVEEKP